MRAAQSELSERGWVFTCAFALEERSAVTSVALAAFSFRLACIVEGAVCSAPDAALPVLRYLECAVGASSELEAVECE